MGLFSIFDGQDSQGVAATRDDIVDDNNMNKTPLSLDLPTVVQLYPRGSHPVRLLEGTASVPSYAVLSYSAVSVTAANSPTAEDADPSASSSPSKSRVNKKPAAAQLTEAPELGVWNVCCVPNSTGTSSRPVDASPLLLLPPQPVQSTYCLTVDLDDPARVEPTISSLQDALVRYLVARPPPATTNNEPTQSDGEHQSAASTGGTSFTTSLHELRTVSFGLAANDAEAASKLGKTQAGGDPDRDRLVRVALVICARNRRQGRRQRGGAPPSGKSHDYRAKQAQALVHYHLRRYAHALHATLCFVDEDDAPSKTGVPESLADDDGDDDRPNPNEQPAMDAGRLAYVLRELATGTPLNLSAPEISTPEGSAFAYVYTISNHNPELIESVLLRNAHYPGEWDAAKESLWKILPPPPAQEAATEPPRPEMDSTVGDNDWLAELRDSVAAAGPDFAKTPAKATRKEVPPDSAQKDAAVSSFFESLLK